MVREDIERRISDGTLRPGERLLAERKLATQFNSSRAVVRSALKCLVSSGKIARHVGRGSFVVDTTRTGGVTPIFLPDFAPAEMIELRCVLEPCLIDLIMLNATNSDIDEIMNCAGEGDNATDRVEWNAVDDRFHRSLAAATHNRVIVALYDAFSMARKGKAWSRLKQQTVNQSLWREFQAQHLRIAIALQHGERDTAFSAARDHITYARMIMLGYPHSTAYPAESRLT